MCTHLSTVAAVYKAANQSAKPCSYSCEQTLTQTHTLPSDPIVRGYKLVSSHIERLIERLTKMLDGFHTLAGFAVT